MSTLNFFKHRFQVTKIGYINGRYVISKHDKVFYKNHDDHIFGVETKLYPTRDNWSSNDESVPEINHKELLAFCIEVSPLENTRESYLDMYSDLIDNFDEPGVIIDLDKPYIQKSKDVLKPEYESELKLIEEYNSHRHCVNEVLDTIQEHLLQDIDIEQYMSMVPEVCKNRFDNAIVNIQCAIKELKEDPFYEIKRGIGYLCVDGANLRLPYKNVPSSWYTHDTTISYTTGYQLKLYVHQKSKIYSIVNDFIAD